MSGSFYILGTRIRIPIPRSGREHLPRCANWPWHSMRQRGMVPAEYSTRAETAHPLFPLFLRPTVFTIQTSYKQGGAPMETVCICRLTRLHPRCWSKLCAAQMEAAGAWSLYRDIHRPVAGSASPGHRSWRSGEPARLRKILAAVMASLPCVWRLLFARLSGSIAHGSGSSWHGPPATGSSWLMCGSKNKASPILPTKSVTPGGSRELEQSSSKLTSSPHPAGCGSRYR
jgi:hypothetical protein